MKRPLLSCVMPVKGPRPYIDAALSSLKEQGMGDDLEIIIQDGDVELDVGQSDALNKGFAKAKGEWLFWLNADDVLLPDALQKIRDIIRCSTSTTSWIAGNVAYLDESGKVLRCAWDRGWKCSYRGMPVQVYGPSSFFHRKLFEQCGLFDTSLCYTMDVDMWCRFRRAGFWYEKVPELVWGFRIHEGSKTHEAQCGGWPKEIAAEHDILNAHYGLTERRIDRHLARFSRLLNGSYLRAFVLSKRWKGHDWKDL